MRILQTSIVMVMAISCALFARTPAEIGAALQSVAPAGKYIKAAFVRGKAANFASQVTGGSIYVVSSKDGIVRKVNTVTGNLSMASLTADGKRVLFHNYTSSKSYVVDWEGTNERQISASGYLGEYWYDQSTKKHYALVCGGGIWRVNIDNTTEKVLVTSKESGGLGTGLSDDGTRVIIYDDQGWGLQTVGSNSVSRGSGGCQGSVRAGPLNQWSCNESGHQNSIVNNPTGSIAFKIIMAHPDSTGEGGRFTQDPDLFTFMKTSNGLNFTQPKNPTIFQVSSKKYVTLLDDVKNTEFCGDMDLVSLDDSGVATVAAIKPLRAAPSSGIDSYSVAGRRLASSHPRSTAHHGVVIISGGEALTPARSVILP